MLRFTPQATDAPPTLVILNACDTADGAAELLEAVPLVIAMSDRVGDASAGVFATHFYGAIAAGQTIGDAIEQGRTMVSFALPDEPEVVTICVAGDVDPAAVRLVDAPADKSLAGA